MLTRQAPPGVPPAWRVFQGDPLLRPMLMPAPLGTPKVSLVGPCTVNSISAWPSRVLQGHPHPPDNHSHSRPGRCTCRRGGGGRAYAGMERTPRLHPRHPWGSRSLPETSKTHPPSLHTLGGPHPHPTPGQSPSLQSTRKLCPVASEVAQKFIYLPVPPSGHSTGEPTSRLPVPTATAGAPRTGACNPAPPPAGGPPQGSSPVT